MINVSSSFQGSIMIQFLLCYCLNQSECINWFVLPKKAKNHWTNLVVQIFSVFIEMNYFLCFKFIGKPFLAGRERSGTCTNHLSISYQMRRWKLLRQGKKGIFDDKVVITWGIWLWPFPILYIFILRRHHLSILRQKICSLLIY